MFSSGSDWEGSADALGGEGVATGEDAPAGEDETSSETSGDGEHEAEGEVEDDEEGRTMGDSKCEPVAGATGGLAVEVPLVSPAAAAAEASASVSFTPLAPNQQGMLFRYILFLLLALLRPGCRYARLRFGGSTGSRVRGTTGGFRNQM